MAVSSRSSGGIPFPGSRQALIERSVPAYEVIKVRVLIKLQERLDLAKARRMPPALFQQTARQQIDQVIEAEAPRLSPTEKFRLAEETYAEAFGCGPLEELFPDATVKEILVLGPNVVVARREHGWTPTNVKFRDAEHVQEVLDRVAALGENVSPGLQNSALDVRLSNGFRVLAVIPPPLLDQPASVVFVRGESGSKPLVELPPVTTPTPTPQSSPRLPIPTNTAGQTPSSGRFATATVGSPTSSPVPGEAQFGRHRVRITERIIKKMASLGVYDVSRVDVAELRKVVAAYIDEYCLAEKVFLSGTDQGRLLLEILAGMKR